MCESVPLSFLSDVQVLIRIACLLEQGEIVQAIQLLEDAHNAKPRSENLLNILSNLYQRFNEYDRTREYTETASCELTLSNNEADFNLPNEDDFAFLAEQSNELEEEEYRFEKPNVEEESLRRKTLSLKSKKQSIAAEDKGKVQIFYKDVHRCPPTHFSPQDDEIKTDFTDTISSLDKLDKGENTYICEPEQSSNPSEQQEEYQNEVSTSSLMEQDGKVFNEWKSEELDLFENCTDAAGLEDTVFEGMAYRSTGDVTDTSEETIPFEDNEMEFYALWDDVSDNEEEESIDDGVLDNRLTLERRARLVAVDAVIELEWHSSKLPFLVEVFTGAGWNNSYKALKREVQAGATYEELELALEVKKFWQDSPRYWITFAKVWAQGESTTATYKHCSWKQSLRLIRLFNGVPTFEEVYDLLETEFEYWYNNRVLRLCFPAFSKYFFHYCLHSRNLNINDGRF
ncbi:tetratricopeptide repeat protein [Vibrio quintilis]|uniref:Uncharacterized protein n=1 Tax=Vibrio quintilis TaxID=1117707 RepID=A0A1M7YUQ7_9VIBR|nr:hypothetical protein [Vibrio quintilis]SHO56325.1 hypothetical protein VQ7734_02094 [Vibrio quintilis]